MVTSRANPAGAEAAERDALRSPQANVRKIAKYGKRRQSDVKPANQAGSSGKQGLSLRQILEPLGGEPGGITGVQRIVVGSLLGRSAPAWMSERQASVVLNVRHCCVHILASVMGSPRNAAVDPGVLRRMVLRVLADHPLRDEVLEWTARATLDSFGNPVYLHRDPGTVRLIERKCRKYLIEAGIRVDHAPKPPNRRREPVDQTSHI